MNILNIQRWHWIAIALLIGAAMGYVMQMPRANWSHSFGTTITQSCFEEGLLREQNGFRFFRDVVVYPDSIELDGRSQAVHIVAGEYFDGKLELVGGQQCAVWRPRCFLAETPFVPLSGSLGPGSKHATVLGYLDSLKGQGVRYRYAWWCDARWGMGFWIAGSLLVIGIVWPCIINLMTFGTLWRPKESPATDLSNVPPSPAREATVSAADAAETAKLANEMQASLADQLSGDAPAAPAQAADVAPLQELSGQKLDLAPAQPQEQAEFGQKKDDFYPTERHRRGDKRE